MNIEVASYDTIIRFGTLNDLKMKMDMQNDTVERIISLRDEKGCSLLESSLSSRNFEVSRFLLENGADVNVVSKEGYNELHYIAANIGCEGAVEIAGILLDKGVSVMQKENRFENTAFFTLCMEAFKSRSADVMAFVERCFEKVTDVDEKNKSGYSIRILIEARGTEELKRKLSENY